MRPQRWTVSQIVQVLRAASKDSPSSFNSSASSAAAEQFTRHTMKDAAVESHAAQHAKEFVEFKDRLDRRSEWLARNVTAVRFNGTVVDITSADNERVGTPS